MNFKITEIDFDTELDDEDSFVSELEKANLERQYIGRVFQVESEDEIADAVSDDSGWCVSSIDYEEVL